MPEIEFPGGTTITDPLDPALTTPASVINRALLYIFPFAGLILFFMLIAGGFQYLTSAGNEEATKKASAKITNALIGFLIIFVAFWLIRLIEVIFGVTIFSIEKTITPIESPHRR